MQLLMRPFVITADLGVDTDRRLLVFDDAPTPKLSFKIFVDAARGPALATLVVAECSAQIECLIKASFARPVGQIGNARISGINHALKRPRYDAIVHSKVIGYRGAAFAEEPQQRMISIETSLRRCGSRMLGLFCNLTQQLCDHVLHAACRLVEIDLFVKRITGQQKLLGGR
jgi:hypothetical protein